MRKFGFVLSIATMAVTMLALFAATALADGWPPHL